MPYVSVNIFTLKSGSMDAFLALNRDQFVPLLRLQPGFIAFEVAWTGADAGVATLWWESEQARVAATPLLAPWVTEHLDPFFLQLDNPSGEVVLSAGRGS